MTPFEVKADCRYYIGEKPCKFKRLCYGCEHYAKPDARILIIKLGALGDVLRTTSILHGLKRKFPECHITWLTESPSLQLLSNIPQIDRLLSFNYADCLALEVMEFDYLYNFDKVPAATSLAVKVKARHKLGFSIDANGALGVFNQASLYALRLGLDDELKFRHNTETYQETTFKQAQLEYKNDGYIFNLTEDERQVSVELRKELKPPLIGLNTGAGDIFATKRWTAEGFIRLAELIHHKGLGSILVLGGPSEVERNSFITAELSKKGIPHYDAGCHNPIRRFASIINACDVIVTADSIAMHLGLALGRKVVVFFGPTCAQEVEMYGRGIKIVKQRDCAPCYKSVCPEPPSCIEEMTPDEVLAGIEKLLAKME